MAWQQRDLLSDNPQPRTSTAAHFRHFFPRVPCGNLLGRSACIQIDLTPGSVFEDQEIPTLRHIFKKNSHLWNSPGCNLAGFMEHCVGHEINIPGYKSDVNITRIKLFAGHGAFSAQGSGGTHVRGAGPKPGCSLERLTPPWRQATAPSSSPRSCGAREASWRRPGLAPEAAPSSSSRKPASPY